MQGTGRRWSWRKTDEDGGYQRREWLGKREGETPSEVKQLEEDGVVRGRSQQAILQRQKVGKYFPLEMTAYP